MSELVWLSPSFVVGGWSLLLHHCFLFSAQFFSGSIIPHAFISRCSLNIPGRAVLKTRAALIVPLQKVCAYKMPRSFCLLLFLVFPNTLNKGTPSCIKHENRAPLAQSEPNDVWNLYVCIAQRLPHTYSCCKELWIILIVRLRLLFLTRFY